MKGNIIHCDPQIEADPATDMVVTRHSADQSDTIHPCFTVSRVDADSMFTIVASNRTGEDQFHTLYFADGTRVQSTDDREVHTGCLDAANSIVYCFAGHVLRSARLDDLTEEEHMAVPAGFTPANLLCTADERFLGFTMVDLAQTMFCTARFGSELSCGSEGFCGNSSGTLPAPSSATTH